MVCLKIRSFVEEIFEFLIDNLQIFVWNFSIAHLEDFASYKQTLLYIALRFLQLLCNISLDIEYIQLASAVNQTEIVRSNQSLWQKNKCEL